MSRIVAFTSVTLDGVMQAPGRPDEDRRGGFEHGGWAAPYADDVTASFAAQGTGGESALLFGRRTYEDFSSVWPSMPQPNPFTELLNRTTKFVASRSLREPLPWQNSVLLKGDATQAAADLKARSETDLLVLGSGELLQSLMRGGLVDEYILLIHPLVLGSGRKLFNDGAPYAPLQLQQTKTSTTGVVIATYKAAAA